MTGEKKCPKCGLRNELDARYCIYCGKNFPGRVCPKCNFVNDPIVLDICTDCGSPLNLRICPKCKLENELDALYCIDCGTPFPRKHEKISRTLKKMAPIFLLIFIALAVWKNLPNKDIKNQPQAILAVKVEDSSNSPLEGVAFSVIGGKTIDYTDLNGKLEIKLTNEFAPRDTLFFELSKEHYQSAYDHLVIKGDAKRFEKRYVMPKVIYGIRFLILDETKNPIEGVSMYRNNVDTYQKSDQSGRLKDSFEELNVPIKYEFKKSYYQGEPWTATKNLFAYSNVIEKQIQLRRLFFTVQCQDTTGIYGNDLGSIRVVNLIDRTERYTDANGRAQFPLSQPGAEVKLHPSKEPIFPGSNQSADPLTVQPAQLVRINVTPIPESLTLTILCPDGSPFRYATVIIDGNKYHGEQITDVDGIVTFKSCWIKPFEQFKITVSKGRQKESRDLRPKVSNPASKIILRSCEE
jgi:hypothetical protein